MKRWVDEVLNPIAGAVDNRPYFTLKNVDGTVANEHVELVLENGFAQEGTPVNAENLNALNNAIDENNKVLTQSITDTNRSLDQTKQSLSETKQELSTTNQSLSQTKQDLNATNQSVSALKKAGFAAQIQHASYSHYLEEGDTIPFDRINIVRAQSGISASNNSDGSINISSGGLFLMTSVLAFRAPFTQEREDWPSISYFSFEFDVDNFQAALGQHHFIIDSATRRLAHKFTSYISALYYKAESHNIKFVLNDAYSTNGILEGIRPEYEAMFNIIRLGD